MTIKKVTSFSKALIFGATFMTALDEFRHDFW